MSQKKETSKRTVFTRIFRRILKAIMRLFLKEEEGRAAAAVIQLIRELSKR